MTYKKRNIFMLKNDETVIFFDTETTGLDAQKDRLVSLYASKKRTVVENDKYSFETLSELNLVIDPLIVIPEHITKINGYVRDPLILSENNLFGKPTLLDVKDEIIDFFDGSISIAHNISFDTKFLQSNISVPLFNEVICTKRIFAELLGLEKSFDYIPNTSLDKLCDFLQIKRDIRDNKHTAPIDTELLFLCFEKLININPELIEILDSKMIPNLYHSKSMSYSY